MLYTLDSSVLTDAVRQPEALELLKQFLGWALPRTVLSSVVASELLAGARSDPARQMVERELIAPFHRRGRVVPPSADVWIKTGISIGAHSGRSVARSLQNDLLLANSAREAGWLLITRDADFSAIKRQVKGLRVSPPYPARD